MKISKIIEIYLIALGYLEYGILLQDNINYRIRALHPIILYFDSTMLRQKKLFLDPVKLWQISGHSCESLDPWIVEGILQFSPLFQK